MPRLFGTDGVRGLANGELTAALALGLAQASAAVLTHGHHADARRASGRASHTASHAGLPQPARTSAMCGRTRNLPPIARFSMS